MAGDWPGRVGSRAGSSLLRGCVGRGLALHQLSKGGARGRPAKQNVAKRCPTRDIISNINNASSRNIKLSPVQDSIIYVKWRFPVDGESKLVTFAIFVKDGVRIRRCGFSLWTPKAQTLRLEKIRWTQGSTMISPEAKA
jgi:hypothetical protein